ncbi:BstXI family restriction endonuclease [Flavobacterium sp. KACC 22761]|uniref:BstXI family restriction endonuclease n=1 Tax=Flavobacterium sp. KACC 22761 TaxID=3092665 RepID=UPI002A74D93B|nr:BstXI family restriction endonuclease [Flavobacterium sp. KACC 22761]WPO78276.1 BstXI family restriction endonuclease [Flavobacterium sp. KACC 22761]
MAKRLPKLPPLLQSKIYKTGQTRSANDDVIYQNRANRNGTVLIPFESINLFDISDFTSNRFESGFIVVLSPEEYYSNPDTPVLMKARKLKLGVNAILLYETRAQWNEFNPYKNKLSVAEKRTSPIDGHFVARIPSSSPKEEKIILGFNTSSCKGAGIRVAEYAPLSTIKSSHLQLEYLFWLCYNSKEIALGAGMTESEIENRIAAISTACHNQKLANTDRLYKTRIIDNSKNTICPLCLKKLSADAFLLNFFESSEKLDISKEISPINLFYINQLKTGEFNHAPYNLAWGHQNCNMICKETGVIETIKWMKEVVVNTIIFNKDSSS